MFRSTTAMRSRSQCSAYWRISSSVLAWCCLVPRTRVSAKTRVSSSTGWRVQNSAACGVGSSSPWSSSWERNCSATSRAFRRLPTVTHLADERGHLQRGVSRLLAAVAHLSARPLPRLLLRQRRDDAERRRHPRRQRHVADPRGSLPRHVLEG